MKYLPISTTVRQLSRVLKKAGLIPPTFDKKSEAQFVTVATGLGFHVNEAKEQIIVEGALKTPNLNPRLTQVLDVT